MACVRFVSCARKAAFLAGILLGGVSVLPAAASEQSASSDQDVIAYINKYLRQGWIDAGIPPSAPATDYEWVRRVYLDLLGRIPEVDEAEKFLRDRSADKKRKLVTELTNSDKYIEEYARNFTTIWTNILIGRTGGTGDRRDMVSREGLQQYLRRALLRNKPYDEMVFELISAEGANKPGEQDYNGAVNFILDNLEEKAAPATAKVAKIFLGMQVQCTQCHNHPFNDWKQDAFWGMNAFFRQAQPLRTGRRNQPDSFVRLKDGDFAGEGSPPTPQEAEIYWEMRNGILKASYPTFIDGTTLTSIYKDKGNSGFVSDVRRRAELAKLIRKSPQMSMAIVNRVWAHFFGYGFTKPIDDMGPHNQPTHPDLLKRLSEDFASQGYDLRQLVRWLTLSEAYSLSSKFAGKNSKDDPNLGERPLFSHFYLRQMTAEQLYESLVVATGAHKTRGSYEEQERQKTQWLQQFAVAFGTDENDEATTFNGTIPQTLMMWNGELINRAISPENVNRLLAEAKKTTSIKDPITYLYMAALSRRPTGNEIKAAKVAWQNHKMDAMKAVQDVFWVVLNSNEFILQH